MSAGLQRSMQHKCRDYGDPDAPLCLGDIDERYTMRFDEIGEPPIYWCTRCGPLAHAMDKELMHALEHEPGFEEKFAAAIADEEARMKKEAH